MLLCDLYYTQNRVKTSVVFDFFVPESPFKKTCETVFFSLVVNESHALFRARDRNVKTSSVVESISLAAGVIILRLYVRSFYNRYDRFRAR